MRTESGQVSVEGTTILRAADAVTEAQLAEYVRSEDFAVAETWTGVDGDQRPVWVPRPREGPSFGGVEEGFPTTSLDTLLIALMD
jgi:hypothetical protein